MSTDQVSLLETLQQVLETFVLSRRRMTEVRINREELDDYLSGGPHHGADVINAFIRVGLARPVVPREYDLRYGWLSIVDIQAVVDGEKTPFERREAQLRQEADPAGDLEWAEQLKPKSRWTYGCWGHVICEVHVSHWELNARGFAEVVLARPAPYRPELEESLSDPSRSIGRIPVDAFRLFEECRMLVPVERRGTRWLERAAGA